MKLSRIADSPALTLALAIVTPPIFVWSKNWHMYNWTSLALSFGVLLAVALLVFAVASFTNALYFRKADSLPAWTRNLIGLFVCVAVALILYFFLYVPLSDLPKVYRRYVIPIGGVILITAIVFRLGFRPLNFFLAFCLFLFSGTGAVDVLQYYSSQRNAVSADSISITLKTKPNIYLFWLESYHSLPIMREVYGIDTGPLEEYFGSREFFIYDNVYSTAFNTLPAMTDLYTMMPHFAPKRGRHDIGPEGRLAIGGGEANAVYRILKENGYHTTFITMDNASYFNTKGRYLDEADIDFDIIQILSLNPLFDLNNLIKKYNPLHIITASKITNRFTGSLFERVQFVMQEGVNRNKPFFLGFKCGAFHVPSAGTPYTWRDKEDWVAGKICGISYYEGIKAAHKNLARILKYVTTKTGGLSYQEGVRKSSQEMMEIVDYIIAEDPQSVIILLGDHGPLRLRDIWVGAKTLSELEALLHDNGESLKSLADDHFGVLMAIRMPDGARDISHGYPMSNVNLFRHIFAALGDDTEILRERQPSWSQIANFVLVKEGVVQRASDVEPVVP